jgi:cell wall-associated NlpC family hydrolase
MIAVVALLAFGAAIGTSEPAAIEAKRAELSSIQAELNSLEGQVEQAAEAYNGARYELGQVTDRIDANERQTVQTQKDLVATRKVLAERLRALYASPDPSLVEVLINSGSITAAADQMQLLDRVGQQDAQVVSGLRTQKAHLAELKVQLEKDRQTAAAAVEAREREKARAESLQAEHQRILDSASAELRQMIEAEKERERQAAAAQARLAEQRAAAAAAASSGTAATASPTASSGAAAGGSSGDASGSAPSTAPLPSGSGNAAAASIAMQYLGVPYVWGGASPSGFDCSGLASYAYAQIGKSVPHYTGAIWAAFPKVPSGQLEPGDMVFFNGLGHMGIYIGGGQYVHAPHTGDVVKVSSLGGRSDYVGAVRP